jgi:hypothetical protein
MDRSATQPPSLPSTVSPSSRRSNVICSLLISLSTLSLQTITRLLVPPARRLSMDLSTLYPPTIIRLLLLSASRLSMNLSTLTPPAIIHPLPPPSTTCLSIALPALPSAVIAQLVPFALHRPLDLTTSFQMPIVLEEAVPVMCQARLVSRTPHSMLFYDVVVWPPSTTTLIRHSLDYHSLDCHAQSPPTKPPPTKPPFTKPLFTKPPLTEPLLSKSPRT